MSHDLIRLSDIVMKFDDEVIIDHLDLYIEDHEFLTLLGPSGCGKTTTLRIIGGFQQPTSGDVFFAGQRINGLPPYKREINTVFQKYALFTHMNIFENVAFGLRVKKVSESEITQRVEEALALVNLAGYGKRHVDSLSGGQQQRVAIGRALITRPSLILADEPTGNLDTQNSSEVIALLKEASKQYEQTIIMITHNRGIAQTADRVLQVSDGVLTDFGRCRE